MPESEVVIEVRRVVARAQGLVGVGLYVDGKRVSLMSVNSVDKARELFTHPGPFFERDFGPHYRLIDKLDEAPSDKPKVARKKLRKRRK